jgi:hypothetical protein
MSYCLSQVYSCEEPLTKKRTVVKIEIHHHMHNFQPLTLHELFPATSLAIVYTKHLNASSFTPNPSCACPQYSCIRAFRAQIGCRTIYSDHLTLIALALTVQKARQ